MNKKQQVKLHIETAEKLWNIRNYLLLNKDILCKNKIDTRRYFESLRNIEDIKNKLDDEYHKVVSENEFKKLGNVYYNQPIVNTLWLIHKKVF